MGVQFSHLVNGHQVASCLLKVGRAGAAASLRLPSCAGGDGLLAQQLYDKLQRSRLVAAAEEQQRVAVADDALPFLFIQRLDLLNVLHDDVQSDIVAAAGSQNLRIALRLGHIRPFVLNDTHRHRQTPVVLLVRPSVKCLKALCVEHSHKVVHAAVINRDHAEDGFFLLTQAAKVHLIHHCHSGILRDIEGGQPHGGAYQNGFRCLSCCLLESLILLHCHMVGLFFFQCPKEHIQRAAVLIVLLPHLGKVHHVDQHFKILFLRGRFADEVEHEG